MLNDNSAKYKETVFKIGQSQVEGLFKIMLWGGPCIQFSKMLLEDVTSNSQRISLLIELIFQTVMIKWQLINLYKNPKLFINVLSITHIICGVLITENDISITPTEFHMSST